MLPRPSFHRAALPAGLALLWLVAWAASACRAPADAPAGARVRQEFDVELASPGARRLDELPGLVEDFTLVDHEGESHEFSRLTHLHAIVLVTHAVGSPVLRAAYPRLRELARLHAADGAGFLLLNSTGRDTRAEVTAEAARLGIELPVLLDEAQLVAEGLGADRVGEALLVDQASGQVLYRGRIAAARSGEADLGTALADWAAERPVATPRTQVEGALVTFGRAQGEAPIRYSTQIAPLVAERCVGCHRAGGIAPFAFSDYRKLRGWSPMVREVVRTKRMPPWAADEGIGHFANDISLSPEEARTLVHWIEQGAVSDEPDVDPLVSAAAAAATTGDEWPLGEPDLVIALPDEEELPAVGLPYYRYREIELGNDEDLWVRAATIKPTNPRVAHHIVVILEYPDELKDQEPQQDNGTAGYFTVYKPNQPSQVFPEGTGKLIPAGSKALFQLHYVTTGKPEIDRPIMGLYLYDEPPKKQLITTGINDPYLEIPPYAMRHEIVAERTFPTDILLYSMGPHMHFRGRAMRADAVYPDGRRETLLNVPRYDFNWQETYWFDEPIFLPAGTQVVVTAVWDNSSHNPANPNPKRRLVFGQDSYSEMLILYMDYMELD